MPVCFHLRYLTCTACAYAYSLIVLRQFCALFGTKFGTGDYNTSFDHFRGKATYTARGSNRGYSDSMVQRTWVGHNKQTVLRLVFTLSLLLHGKQIIELVVKVPPATAVPEATTTSCSITNVFGGLSSEHRRRECNGIRHHGLERNISSVLLIANGAEISLRFVSTKSERYFFLTSQTTKQAFTFFLSGIQTEHGAYGCALWRLRGHIFRKMISKTHVVSEMLTLPGYRNLFMANQHTFLFWRDKGKLARVSHILHSMGTGCKLRPRH